MLNRRAFLGALGLLAAPRVGETQPARRIAQIGYLSPLSRTADAPRLAAFRVGLTELGYRERQNIALESRWADGSIARQDVLAVELVRLKVDVLLAAGGHHTVRAAKKVTTTIPIVMTRDWSC